ncbi:acyl-CoA synthetase [Salmonella enterica subsp. arizonae]|uniref:Acyl-CoA synthetase n=1 Tax=Salmonella enterica subsp. arizonae TaxID=59203 RepID=A0A3S4I8U2_SALER|nr:acyl-CoA synthetase [Salmonella enterica subsp. arizonae]
MSQQGLEALLRPKSIAVIGASMKPHRAGYLMMRNLLAGGFNGPVLPVTPAWKSRFRRHGLAGYRQSPFYSRSGYFMH